MRNSTERRLIVKLAYTWEILRVCMHTSKKATTGKEECVFGVVVVVLGDKLRLHGYHCVSKPTQ